MRDEAFACCYDWEQGPGKATARYANPGCRVLHRHDRLIIMTRTNHDQFAKQYLAELLAPLGSVEPGREVTGSVQQADIWFIPGEVASAERLVLGLLSQMASSPCLLEPFRNPPNLAEVRSCLLKLFLLHGEFQRQSRRDRASGATSDTLKEDDLPRLWILVPSASTALLDGFGAKRNELDWPEGIYLLPQSLRTALVALNKLPRTESTLWLRILGKGATQRQAIDELLALSKEHPLRNNVLELLANWRIFLEEKQTLDEEERELIMNLSPAYLQRMEEARLEGQRVVVENLLKIRFGTLDSELSRVIEPLLQLPPEEFTPMLLNLERSELLNRFRGQTH